MRSWSRPLVEELEERILYSADFAPALLAAPSWSASGVEQSSERTLALEAGGSEIVIIDAAVTDADRLAADLERQRSAGRAIEVVRIDAAEDGIDRIGATLAQRDDIAAVHIVAHGADGSLRLGTATLDAGTLLARAADIAGWSSALGADADFLVYGCDLAAGADGRALIEGLAALTGADVAASDDPTGTTAAGGDWQLEYRVGTVEAALAPSVALQQSWHGVLNTAAGPSSTGTAIFAESGQSQPRIATWDGMAFGPESGSSSIGQLRNLQAAEAPTRNEIIVMGVDAAGDIRGSRWDGAAWSTLPFSGNASESNRTGFAVAYEQASGHALAVWNDDVQAPGAKLRYALWDGSAWSAASAIGAYAGAEPQHMQLAAKPGSDELVLVVNDANSDDYALVWDGTAWGNAIGLDASGTAEDDQTALAVAYESASGRAMVAYGKNGDTELYYRHWNGAAWSGEATGGLPAAALSQLRWLTLASDPNSDRIAAGALRSDLLGSTALFSVWSGSSWGPAASSSSLLGNVDDRSVAVAFESGSGAALGAYAANDNVVRYRTWTAAGGWSGPASGPNLGANPSTLSLAADPYTDQIMLAANDSARDLNFVLWNGATWGSSTQLSGDSGDSGNEPFAFVWQQTPPAANATSIWLSPKADSGAPGWPGLNAVYGAEIVALGAPGLSFSPATTGGVFSHLFDLREFAVDGNINLDAVHYVSRDVALPGLTLQAGDVLFSTDSDETLSADNTLAVLDNEVVVFRPNIAGDYRSGTFIMLLDNFGLIHGGSDTTALALVEQDTILGELTLAAGSVLFTRDGATDSNVYVFTPTAVGAGSTAGLARILLRGSDIGLNAAVSGLHLVTAPTPIGNVVLPAAALLMSVDADDGDVGTNALSVAKEDVFYLTVTRTSMTALAQATATAFLRGNDIGIAGERFDALALHESNSAPVLDPSGAPTLAAIAEDALDPMGTSVAALLATGASGDPITDANALDPEGIAVIGLDVANGTWQFSTTGGASWSAFGPVGSASATLLDAAAHIRFVPNANFNGTSTLSFRAWDGFSGSNGQSGVDTSDNGGASAFSAAFETATLTVTAVNDDPVLALNAGMTVNQGATVTIGASRLASSDIDHAAAALTYTLTAVPVHGMLKIHGTDLLLSGAMFTQADLDAGLISYVHDGSVDPSDSFGFTVTDALGGSAGAAASFSIAITLSNATPAITTNALAITEGGWAVPNLVVSDDNTPAQLAYTVSGVSGGHFELASNPGVAITAFTQAQVDGALVRFVHDGGETAPSYALSVSDGAASAGPMAAAVTFTNVNDAPVITTVSLSLLEGGTATPVLTAADPDSAAGALVYTVAGVTHGRFELVAAPGTAITSFSQAQIDAGDVVFVHDGDEAAPAFQVSLSDGTSVDGPQAAGVSFTRVNDAPAIATGTLTLSEGQTLIVSSADIGAVDPDSAPWQLTWTVSGMSNGYFEYVSDPGVAVTSFTQAEIDAGSVRFVHDGGELAPAFTLALSDGSLDATPQTAGVTFTGVNDAPVITANALSVTEGGALVLTAAQVGASDPDHAPSQLIWTVSALSGGRFEYAAIPGVAITSFTQADIDAARVRFVHDGNEAAPSYALTLSDAMAAAGPSIAAVTYTSEDDAPVLALNAGAEVTAGESVVISNAMLRATDVDSHAAQLAIALLGLPAQGTLLLAGRVLVAGDHFAQADIDAGLLSYRADGSAAAADGFTFRVADESTSLGSATFSIVIGAAPVDPPAEPPAPPSAVLQDPASAPAPQPSDEQPTEQLPMAAAPVGPAAPAAASESPPQQRDTAQPAPAAAAMAEPLLHPLAPAPSQAAGEAGVRTLATLADAPRDSAPVASSAAASNWFGRPAPAAPSLATLLSGFIAEARALDTSPVFDTQFSSAQPPREALLELEAVRSQIEEQLAQSRSVVASTIAVSTGLSVGYVLWLVRGGLLLTSVLSALPAWQVVDPLPVLGTMKREQDDSSDDDDAIEGMFRRSGMRARSSELDAAAAPARNRLLTEAEA